MNRRQFTTLTAASLITQEAQAAAASAAADSVSLRVLSFNLRYINSQDEGALAWVARRDSVARVIHADSPDLIGFQEALRPMLDDVAARVAGFQEIGVGREDGKGKGEYTALFVKTERFTVRESGTFWLSDTPEVPNSRTWKNRVTRVCTWAKMVDKTTNKAFCFFNVHLDHESQEAREKGVALVQQRLASIAKDEPFVLTGDFNAVETNAAIVALREGKPPLTDAWRKCHPDVPLTESGTMHGFSGAHDGGKIDYIFVPPGCKCREAAIIHTAENGNYPSDHFPIRATIEL